VVCVDTLEHLPPRDRGGAIRELVRVARSRVIISGPTGAFADAGDRAFAETLTQLRAPLPGWLSEHVQHGIPGFGELLGLMVQIEHPVEVHVNECMLQHYGGLFLDNFPFIARIASYQRNKFPALSPLLAGQGDPPYSLIFSIDTATACRRSHEPAGAAAVAGPPAAVPPKTAMFAVGHRPDRMPKVPGIRRILAGTASFAEPLDADVLREIGGDTICDRNAGYSEMSAIFYWIWKNVGNLDGIGFCHYRRYFDLRSTARPPAVRQAHLRDPREVCWMQEHFANAATIDKHIAAGDIAIARPTELEYAVPEQYMIAHLNDDYLRMLNYLLDRHRGLDRHIVEQAMDHSLVSNNMFLMRWSDFDELCGFWFDVLFGIEKRLVYAAPSKYQARNLAFLSERVLDIYIRLLRACARSWKQGRGISDLLSQGNRVRARGRAANKASQALGPVGTPLSHRWRRQSAGGIRCPQSSGSAAASGQFPGGCA